MRIFLLIVSIGCFPFIIGDLDRSEPLPDEQAGCRYCPHTMIFYENHKYYVNDSTNWICQEPFNKLLKYCFTMYKIMSTRKVSSEYKIEKDEESVKKVCEKHRMTFLRPLQSGTVNVTLDINMFHCPMNKMDLKFPPANSPPVIRDFYITEGRNQWTIAVLRNSTSCDNICVTNMYKPARDFIKEYFK